MITEKNLRVAAKELNKVLGVDPPLDEKLEDLNALTEQIVEILDLIDPKNDILSEATIAVVRELNPKIYPEPEEEIPEPESLLTEVNGTDDLTELKTIAKANEEFKSIRGKLSSYKKAKDLKNDMLELLNEEKEEQQKKAEEIHKKNIASKPVRAANVNVKVDKGEPKVKKTPGFKREGSFAEWLDGRVQEGGTWQEIYDDATAEAAARNKTTSLGVIKGHVKFRLVKNDKFLGKLKVTNEGIM